jgi:hypothetical protein
MSRLGARWPSRPAVMGVGAGTFGSHGFGLWRRRPWERGVPTSHRPSAVRALTTQKRLKTGMAAQEVEVGVLR